MSKILDGLLFAGPALAVALGLLFALAPSRVFARTPRRLTLGLVVPMLIAIAGAWRLRQAEADMSVLLAVIGIALAACAVGFAGAFGLAILLRACVAGISAPGGRRSSVPSAGSGFVSRRQRAKGLPPGPRIKQGK